MSVQALVIYKNEINNIGNALIHHNDNKVRINGYRLKVLADKMNKAISAIKKEVEAAITSPNSQRDAITTGQYTTTCCGVQIGSKWEFCPMCGSFLW